MSSDHDPRFSPGDEPDEQFDDEEAPRSIFSAAWFRVVLVVLAVAVVGAISVPYVLDVVSVPGPAPAPQTAVAPVETPKPTTTESSAPSTPSPVASAQPPAPAPAAPTTAKNVTPTEGGRAPATAQPAPSAKAPERAPAPKAPAPAATTAKKESPSPERAVVAKAQASAPARPKRSEGGDYFVQVGAFQDPATAKRLASRLRDQNYPVDESSTRGGDAPSAAPRPTPRVAAASGPDRYDVIVSGASTTEINSKLSAKGLASEPAGESVRIRPSLSLRDAVALSKDLGTEGFKVQVRRGAGGAAAPAAAEQVVASSAAGDGPALHRVRVGPYPDRAAAVAAHRELQEKGYQPFIAKGRE